MNNRYMVIKNTGEIVTDVYFAQTFQEAKELRLVRILEGWNTVPADLSDWFISERLPVYTGKIDAWLRSILDWLHTRTDR